MESNGHFFCTEQCMSAYEAPSDYDDLKVDHNSMMIHACCNCGAPLEITPLGNPSGEFKP